MHCERGDPWEFLSPSPVVVWLASTSESRENERDFAFHHCCLTGWAPLWPKYLEDCRPLILLLSVPWWFYVQDIQCEFWWWWTFQAPPWGRPWRSWRGRWASWRGTSSPRSSSLSISSLSSPSLLSIRSSSCLTACLYRTRAWSLLLLTDYFE